MNDISSISCDSLQSMLCFPDVMLIDVRSCHQYQHAHINGAISLAFPTIMWKRFVKCSQQPGSIESFLVRRSDLARRASSALMVLYDETTEFLATASQDSPIVVLSSYFQSEGREVCFLEGGLSKFRSAYPQLITSTNIACDESPTQTPVTSSGKLFPFSDSTSLTFINHFIAVGSEQDAHNISLLDRKSITHVLNLTSTDCHPLVVKNRKWMKIALHDSLQENLLMHLQGALEFIHSARESHGRILVHCIAGISRSVAVAIAYLMWSNHLDLHEAMDIVQAHRECASPNLNFMGQLMVFGKILRQEDMGCDGSSGDALALQRSLSAVCRDAATSLGSVAVSS